jgi:hypothetical protein
MHTELQPAWLGKVTLLDDSILLTDQWYAQIDGPVMHADTGNMQARHATHSETARECTQ